MSDFQITVDNRVRLVSAVLATGRWPEIEQAQKPHAVHQHAKQTRQFTESFDDHDAVELADAYVSGNGDPTACFHAALACRWPTFEIDSELPADFADEAWAEALMDFYTDTAVAAFFWADHEAVWNKAVQELKQIFQGRDLARFMERSLGLTVAKTVHVCPNLVHPALKTIAASNGTGIYLILPPPQAWGESPPWPYSEGADWVLAECCYRLVEQLVPIADADKQAILAHAVTVLFLEQSLDEPSAQAYLVRTKIEEKRNELPEAVATLREFVKAPAGRQLAELF